MASEPQTTTPGFGRDQFTDFDFESPEFNERFDEVLDELVAKCPMARSEARPVHFVWVMNYLDEYLQMRAKEPPRGDVIDVIVAGVEKDGEPCPWEDKVATLLDVCFGGLAR